MPITKEQIAAAKAANSGEELTLFANADFGVEWLVRTPGDLEWQAWRAQQSAAGDDVVPINREFVIRHVAFPDGRTDPAVRALLAKYPGLIESATRAMVKLAGARAEFSLKKV